jgi:magnesium chelatase subunit I
VYTQYFGDLNVSPIVQWFELGGTLKLDESLPASQMIRHLSMIQGLMEKLGALGLGVSEPDAVRASAAEFILEGLYAHRRISRSEERGYAADERKREVPEEPRQRPRRQFN